MASQNPESVITDVIAEIEVDTDETTLERPVQLGDLENIPYINQGNGMEETVILEVPIVNHSEGIEDGATEGLIVTSNEDGEEHGVLEQKFPYQTYEGKRRGSTVYAFNDFEYVQERKRERRIPLKCSLHRKLKCPGRATVFVADSLAKMTKPHNHSCEAYESGTHRLKSALKKAAEERPGSSLRDKFNELTRQDPNGAKVSFTKMASIMYKRQRLSTPKVPQTPNDFVDLLEQHPELGQCQMGIIRSDGDVESVIFSSQKLLTALQESQKFEFDGTFYVCPAIFAQIFTLFAEKEGHSFPCLVVLMTNRRQEAYTRLLDKLTEMIPDFQPTEAMADFETASRNAVLAKWPAVVLRGCFFHFSQAVMRQLKKIGLTKMYKQNVNFRRWAKSIMCLPLLPADKIQEAFVSLESVIFADEVEKVNAFKAYVRRQWVDGTPAQQISVFGAKTTTNNAAESWHSWIKKSIMSHRPNIWSFISKVNNFIADIELDLQRQQNGLQISRGPKANVLKNVEHRRKLENKLIEGELTPIQFLQSASYTATNILAIAEDNQAAENEEVNDFNEITHCSLCRQIRYGNHIFLPCRHGNVCTNCVRQIQENNEPCPRCFQPFADVFEII